MLPQNSNGYLTGPGPAPRFAGVVTLGGTGRLALEPGARIDLYNVGKDGAVDYERGTFRWSANVFQIGVEKGGTGSARSMQFFTSDSSGIMLYDNGRVQVSGAAGGQWGLTHSSDQLGLFFNGRIVAETVPSVSLGNDTFGSPFSGGAGVSQVMAKIGAALNQTATAAFTALDIAITGTGGSGAQKLINASYGGTQRFAVDSVGSLDFEGGIKGKPVIAAQAGAYTLLATDVGVQFDTAAAGRTANLPAAASVPGQIFFIRANGANTVTVDPNGAELIDGAATIAIASNTGRAIMSTGAAWLSVA